jgi:hypothetical protein
MVGPDEADRALWACVVLQAREDVEHEVFGSTDYDAAEAFLTADTRYWREGRRAVCAHLGVHGDDLRRAGLRWCNARRLREGQPPLAFRPPVPNPAPAAPPLEKTPLPRLVATFAPPKRERRCPPRWSRENNPFGRPQTRFQSPFLKHLYG